MKPPLEPSASNVISSRRGSAFIQALLAIGVIGIIMYFLAPTVIKHRQQASKSASIITTRLALHSMMDFTLLGIKQRWCFSDTWMPENCGKSVNATTAEILSHPRSVERLLMKDETVDFLKAMSYPNPTQVPLDKITARIPVGSFSSLHPIYKIISDLKGYKVSAFDVLIERDKRGVIPEYGRELYLKVTVKLLDETGTEITVGSSKLEATSFVGVYPREVGSFALLVPNDLHLDAGGASQQGDASFKQFGSRTERLQYPGLVFDSPVYVNGSIYLPTAKDISDGSDTVYSPVVFNEKVILGDGQIMRASKEFRPSTAGGETDQFWSNVAEFGGFQKGVEVDGGRDGGLDVLSGKSASTSVDKTLMQQCLNLKDALTNLNATKNSKLTGALSKNSGAKFDYRLGLTSQDIFNRQTGEPRSPSVKSPFMAGMLAGATINGKNGAIAGYEISIGNQLVVVGDIPDNGSVSISPKVDLSNLAGSIEKQISTVQSDRDTSVAELSRIDDRITRTQGEINDLQNDLTAEQAKNPQNPDKIASIQADIARANAQLDNYKNQKTAKEKAIDDAKNKLADLQKQLDGIQANMALQPKINLSVDVPNPDSTNLTFKDFHVEFENGQVLVDSTGKPLDVSVKLQAYDVSFYRGYPINPLRASQANGYINFLRNGTLAFNPFAAVSDQYGNSKGDLPAGDINVDMNKACNQSGLSGSAFAGTDWGTSFTGSSVNSWSFTNAYADRVNLVFDGNNASKANGTATFTVKSMAKDCIIRSSADFVSGFLTCERLIVESRSSPLRIIGSIIVTNGIQIDDSAYTQGIRWSTIYHPQATFELRQAGILKGQNNADCSTINRFPVWHPSPSITDVSNLYRCNAISLRSQADPFRWTMVDPDCGAIPGGSSHVCKNRMVRFYVLEVSRESGI